MTLWRALRRFIKGDGIIFSGYLAFLSLLALLPVLGVLFWLSQQSGIIKAADAAFRDFLFSHLFPDTAKQVVAVVDKLRANARGLGQTGVVIILGDLLLKALALDAAVDRIWGSPQRSLWGYVRGVVVLLLALPLVVGVLYWLILYVEGFLIDALPSMQHLVESAFDPIEIGVPLIAALALLYRWGPTHSPSWRPPLMAATLITALIELSRYVITHYFAQMQQLKSLYGAFIAFPVLIVTLFVIWALVLYGAALVAEGFGAQWKLSSRGRGRGASKNAKRKTADAA